MRARTLLLATLLVSGCASADPRFETPEQTVRSLLGSYRLADVPEAAVRERLAAHGTFTLADEATFAASFADHQGPLDDGAAAYVLGRVAAAKDHLLYREVGDEVHVGTMHGGALDRLAVLTRTDDGYRFVLASSVPREVRTQLRAVYRRRSAELARRGIRG